jgi:hypothetical protein
MLPLGAEPGAALPLSLQILREADTTQTYHLETELNGSFHAAGLPAGDLQWAVTYVQGNKVYRWGGALQLSASGSVTLTPELSEGNQTSITW